MPRADIEESALTPTQGQTFCPYKGLASYYNIGDRAGAAWSYPRAWPEVARVTGLVSFEPDKIDVSWTARNSPSNPVRPSSRTGTTEGWTPKSSSTTQPAPPSPRPAVPAPTKRDPQCLPH